MTPGQHPASSGHALRQSVWWWDTELRRWAIEDLDDEHLLAVIDWLRQHAHRLYTDELADLRLHVPCPVWAYPSARSWLADTPLMRALLRERHRRARSRRTE